MEAAGNRRQLPFLQNGNILKQNMMLKILESYFSITLSRLFNSNKAYGMIPAYWTLVPVSIAPEKIVLR
ncbi:MAG: hypothetical protein ABIR78_13755 [Ferruginibacter sp.]